MSDTCLVLTNTASAPLGAIPVVPLSDFASWHQQKLTAGARVCAFFAVPRKGGASLYSVLAEDKDASLLVLASETAASYPSLTPRLPALHLFEREIFEQHGILPEGHPWLKPVRFENEGAQVGVTDFFTIDGDEVHEVGVGPIHAGIIECGHFRFQCQGEVVMHLEISLGYHHRGIERACKGIPGSKTLALMETAAGDTSIGHSWAYCSNIETLANIQAPLRAQQIRAIALELERLANHTGDLGALAGDIGYLPTASFCGRLRGDYLNTTAILCGNRFGRNLLVPGGIRQDLAPEHIESILTRLSETARDTLGASRLLWNTDSVTARMMGRGILTKTQALELGLVGLAARASGIARDARSTHPLPHMAKHDIPLHTHAAGDVFARAQVREKEITESVSFIRRLLSPLTEGDILAVHDTPLESGLKKNAIAVSLVEGWRGEICHVAMTDGQGAISDYKIVDPSFHNWIGLALAMRLQQISDFPLCNKSFNLSYCGHDL